MSLKHAILGFLSWQPFSGYDLKKCFTESTSLYWSGNNNQIYTSLVQLHREGLVEVEIQFQPSLPAKKVYTITPNGRQVLRDWLLTTPEPPDIKKALLVQLAWADQLAPNELDDLLSRYEEEVDIQLRMHAEKVRRSEITPCRSARETYLWSAINQNISKDWENELSWVREIRKTLKEKY